MLKICFVKKIMVIIFSYASLTKCWNCSEIVIYTNISSIRHHITSLYFIYRKLYVDLKHNMGSLQILTPQECMFMIGDSYLLTNKELPPTT